MSATTLELDTTLLQSYQTTHDKRALGLSRNNADLLEQAAREYEDLGCPRCAAWCKRKAVEIRAAKGGKP